MCWHVRQQNKCRPGDKPVFCVFYLLSYMIDCKISKRMKTSTYLKLHLLVLFVLKSQLWFMWSISSFTTTSHTNPFVSFYSVFFYFSQHHKSSAGIIFFLYIYTSSFRIFQHKKTSIRLLSEPGRPCGVVGGLVSPVVFRREVGYNLDRSPVPHKPTHNNPSTLISEHNLEIKN